MVDESQLTTRPVPASATAMTAMRIDSQTTVDAAPPSTMLLTTRPARTGVSTVSTATTTLSTMNTASLPRCGRANSAIRRIDSRRFSRLRSLLRSGAFIDRYSVFLATDSILIQPL